jgi:hypothetical protein
MQQAILNAVLTSIASYGFRVTTARRIARPPE